MDVKLITLQLPHNTEMFSHLNIHLTGKFYGRSLQTFRGTYHLQFQGIRVS
jgi:hypothetical protein